VGFRMPTGSGLQMPYISRDAVFQAVAWTQEPKTFFP
jgi:hypothetical protein